jgi:hypothetical protein
MPQRGTAIRICRPPRIFILLFKPSCPCLKKPNQIRWRVALPLSSTLIHQLSWLCVHQLSWLLSLDQSGHEPNKAQSTNLENTIGIIGSKSLQELRYLSGDADGRPVGPFGGNKGARYIYTKKGGWVDLGHFFQVAAGLQEKMPGKTKVIGKIVETYSGTRLSNLMK